MGLFVDKQALYHLVPGQGCDILELWMKIFSIFAFWENMVIISLCNGCLTRLGQVSSGRCPVWKTKQESFDGLQQF